MRALLWKDLRSNRQALVFGGVLLFLPYAFALTNGVLLPSRSEASWWSYDHVLMTGFISLVISFLTVTILAGNAFAAERGDRSAEFLACMPPSRWKVLASKVVLTGGACLLVVGLNVITIFGLAPRMPGAPSVLVPGVHDDPAVEFLHLMVGATMLLGIAWFCSAVVTRGSTAIAAALLALPAFAGLLLAVFNILGISYIWFAPAFRFGAIAIGLAGMAAGTICFVRRFEP